MKLYYSGHRYVFACEQSLLVLFPEERPEYPETRDTENAAYISLSEGNRWATAVTRLYRDGRRCLGTARIERCRLTDGPVRDRLLQRILRLSFYRAARRHTGRDLPWGALTGVRPGKLALRYLESGLDRPGTAAALERDFFVSPERAALCAEAGAHSLAVKGSLRPEDVCLYVGIPFCPTRCAYCSFVSVGVEKSAELIEPYLAALRREIAATGEIVRRLGLRPVALYIGGGTPTTLSAEQLSELMSALREAFDLSALREYTVEAGRPDTVTAEKLGVLRENGCGRVSVNPQTMSDGVLRAIGRRHTAEETVNAYRLARDAGFCSVNMDLIAGLPSDTREGFRETLSKVIKLDPENVTVHTLSLKKGTRITVEGTALPGEETVSGMLEDAEKALKNAGYRPYYLYRQKYISGGFENVGWCRPGTESLYNVCIMEELCTVLAMGAGGSTKLVNPRRGFIERLTEKKYPREFIDTADEAVLRRKEIEAFYARERILDPAGPENQEETI